MGLLLVVARPGAAADGVAAPAAGGSAGTPESERLWRTVRREVSHLRTVSPASFSPARLDDLAAALEESEDDPTVAYAATASDALAAAGEAIAMGAAHVAVIPVGLAMAAAEDNGRAPALLAGDLVELEAVRHGLDALGSRHPSVALSYVGPPFDDAPALDAAIAALRSPGSDEPTLFAGAVARGFDGDLDRLARFMTVLQRATPPDTRLVLRGSAVQGESYRTGEPFDARGPGTSDLDIVLIGEAAMAEWRPDAFYLPGVNTQPLCDAAPDLAPGLEPARIEAQRIAARPVALQAMARWFLDLRSGLQGTPYVTLG